MWRRLLILVLALGVAFTLIGASQEVVTIRIVGFSGDTPMVEALLAHLRDLGKFPPNVEVVWEPEAKDMRERVLTDLAAETVADIYYIDVYWAEEAAKTGRLEPLNEYIARSEELGPDLRDVLLEPLVEAFEFDVNPDIPGKEIYAIAKDFNSLVIWYNKDYFQEAGVPFPDNDDTWDDFLRKARLVNERALSLKAAGGFAVNLNPDPVRYLPFAFANGMPFLLEDGCAPFGTPEAIEAAVFYTAPILGGFGATSADLGVGWPGAAFTAEKAALVNEGGWMLGPIMYDNPLLDFGAAFLPLTPDTKERANYLFTVGYAIPIFAEHKDLAFKVIEALTSFEAQLFMLERLAIPSRKALVEAPESPLVKPTNRFQEGAKVVFEATSQPGTRPFTFGAVGGGDYLGVLGEALTKIMVEKVPVVDAMKEAALELNRRMEARGLIAPGQCPTE